MLVLAPAIAERRQGIGRLAGLGDEQSRPARLHRDFAIAELRGDIHVRRQLGPTLEPILRDDARIIGGPARGQGQAAHIREIEGQVRQRNPVVRKVEIVRECMADDFGLLVNLLRHEVAEIALVHHEPASVGFHDGAVDDRPIATLNTHPLARDHGPIAVFQIGDIVGKGCECDRIGADEHLPLAVADGQGAALPRGDHQVVIALEDHREGERAFEMGQNLMDGGNGIHAVAQLARDEMRDHLRIRIGGERGAFSLKFGLQLPEILDDAVVDHGDVIGHVRMGIGFAGPAMRRPARMTDPGVSRQRLGGEQRFEIAQLSFSPAPLDPSITDCGNTRRIVAAILETLQRVDQQLGDRPLPKDANNSAHRPLLPRRHGS